MLGILQSAEIEDVLKTGLIGRIGCHADGETYVVPISYGYDGDYLYCHTHDGKKNNDDAKDPPHLFSGRRHDRHGKLEERTGARDF